MQCYTYAAIPLLIFGFWTYTALVTQRFPTLQGKRILLLIAHPDDEAMFFGPSLLGLTRPELGNHIKILCLSSGDADGLGEIRKKEIVQSGLMLGMRTAEDVMVIEDAAFPDSMTKDWDRKLIAKMLTGVFAPQMTTLPLDKKPVANIDILITFDAGGISNHPNHRSLHHGAVAFLKTMMQGRSGWECPITLYTLTTTGLFRKYLSILDSPLTLAAAVLGRKETGTAPTPLLFVSGVGGWRTAQNAMVHAHKSQMRWFRCGWIGLSRYMVINDLKKVKVR